MPEIDTSLQVQQLVNSILIFDEIIKVEWDGRFIRCLRNINKEINRPTIHQVAIKMELLKTLCSLEKVSPFSMIGKEKINENR